MNYGIIQQMVAVGINSIWTPYHNVIFTTFSLYINSLNSNPSSGFYFNINILMIYLVSSKEAWSGRFHHMCRGQLDGVIHWYFGKLFVRCASTDFFLIFLIALVLLEKGKAQVLKNAFSCATSFMTIKQQRFFTLYKRIVIWYMQYSIKSTKCHKM